MRLDNQKVQVGKDQEKARPEKDSHSKNRDGEKKNNDQILIPRLLSYKYILIDLTVFNTILNKLATLINRLTWIFGLLSMYN